MYLQEYCRRLATRGLYIWRSTTAHFYHNKYKVVATHSTVPLVVCYVERYLQLKFEGLNVNCNARHMKEERMYLKRM